MTIMETAFGDKRAKRYGNMKPAKIAYPKSRKFILTGAASKRLGEIIDSCETSMLANFQFAIPPYPVTYLEFNAIKFFEGLNRPMLAAETDGRIGFLWYDNRIEYAVSNSDQTNYVWGAFSFIKGMKTNLNEIPTNHSIEEKRQLTVNLMLGSSYSVMENPEQLLNEWKVVFAYKELVNFKRILTEHLFKTANGDLRNFLCAMLVLNQPELLHYDHIPRKPGGAARQNKPFAAHTIVTINIGEKKEYVKHFGGILRGPPRRHEVRGHFYHHNCKKWCEHNWPVEPTINEGSTVKQWKCSKCGGIRSWREHHMRGDASVGYTTKDYDVDYQQGRK